jgi:CheY-like chemotaxis protein
VPADKQPNDQESEMPLKKSQAASRILVADDDPVIRRWLTSILQTDGYEVVSVSDGREVYRLFHSDANFRAAVLDLSMPGLNGLDLVRHMRSEKRLMRIPVMMITAESQIKLLASGLAAGATLLLPKPFTRVRLQHSLSMMLGNPPAEKKSSLPTDNRRVSLADRSLSIDLSDNKCVEISEKPNDEADLDQPVVLEVLRGLESGDEEEASALITELIDLYLESAGREVNAIKLAAHEHNERAFQERAHALKGCSSTIGAVRMARICEQLEATGEQDANDGREELVKKLENELAAVRTVLLAERIERLQPAGI